MFPVPCWPPALLAADVEVSQGPRLSSAALELVIWATLNSLACKEVLNRQALNAERLTAALSSTAC